MIRHDKRSATPVVEENQAIIAELDHMYSAALPPHLRDSVDHAIFSRMATPAPRRSRSLRLPRVSWVPLALVTALAVALGGVGSVVHLTAPATASAQPVLRHAAAVSMPANAAMHLTYAVAVSSPGQETGKALPGGTANVWIESDGSGGAVRSSQTRTLTLKSLTSRYIQEGGQTYSYNPELRGDNVIAIAPEARGDPSWLIPTHMFDGASVAAYLNGQGGPGTRLLPQQTLNGHTVDVVQVDGGSNRPALRTTFYFDAHTYLLRGFDAVSDNPSYSMPSWRVRLTGAATMPASSAPADAFRLNEPTAEIKLTALDYFTGFDNAFQTVCHASLTFKQAVGSGRTPIAVCRETNPSVTQTGLVDALVASVGSDLPIALQAGQITQTQEAEGLQTLRTQMTAMVTSLGPPKVATPGVMKG